jgi:hypothetical protein
LVSQTDHSLDLPLKAITLIALSSIPISAILLGIILDQFVCASLQQTFQNSQLRSSSLKRFEACCELSVFHF